MRFTAQKKKSFPLRIFSVNVTISADLVTCTKEIFNEKLHFLCTVILLMAMKMGLKIKNRSHVMFPQFGAICTI